MGEGERKRHRKKKDVEKERVMRERYETEILKKLQSRTGSCLGLVGKNKFK